VVLSIPSYNQGQILEAALGRSPLLYDDANLMTVPLVVGAPHPQFGLLHQEATVGHAGRLEMGRK
jgi:hypothetical protein